MVTKLKNAITNLFGGDTQKQQPTDKLCKTCGKPLSQCDCKKKKGKCDCKMGQHQPDCGKTDFHKKVAKPTVPGELYYSSCNEAYGPVRLESVDKDLLSGGSGNIVGANDCSELEFAPVNFSIGGPQFPSVASKFPSLAQLKTPGIDSIQGIIRPKSFEEGSSGKTAKVTMVWADWCGYSKKAKPEWDSLVSEMNGKSVDGCKVQLRDLEQKRDEAEIKKDYSDVTGFPTYVVEVADSSGKLLHKGSFNSIKKDDMAQKIKAEIAKA
jgi:thiol-disulfide isomerase/thioredoxin